MCARLLSVALLLGTASALTLQKKGPLDDQVDSFGNSKLEPACAGIKCGAMECVAPFTLKAKSRLLCVPPPV